MVKTEKDIIKSNKKSYINCLNCNCDSKIFKKYMSIDGNKIPYLETYCTYLSKKIGVKCNEKNNHCICFKPKEIK